MVPNHYSFTKSWSLVLIVPFDESSHRIDVPAPTSTFIDSSGARTWTYLFDSGGCFPTVLSIDLIGSIKKRTCTHLPSISDCVSFFHD